uniref:Uncharacterized protein n=1 Tax=Romanomermis culicivorax TaxID=13658 RepID=A0A915KLF1_ROMCU
MKPIYEDITSDEDDIHGEILEDITSNEEELVADEDLEDITSKEEILKIFEVWHYDKVEISSNEKW